MDHTTTPQPYAAPVLYTPDGTPYYAHPAPLTAPPVLYHPGAPLPVPAQHPVLPTVHAPAPLPQYLPAAPARDPWPARLLAGGIGIGGAGLGVGFLLQTLAAATTGLGLLVAALGVVYLLKNSSGGGGRTGQGAVNVHVNVTNRNR
ncbi:hypothetical protein OG618_18140 [Kitasatospora sp. NBC_01246]|uniref:hypothetical protein n=1 Tax=Kitasatospora sp. NBC_01246 TaxID=2903570 RepID=UPI002E31521D|nr:hypothetical protein [Kitasatospora sp. NBC_01246]